MGASSNPQAAGFVLEMVKTIRGLGGTSGHLHPGGMQGPSSGWRGRQVRKGILDSSRIKLIMQMEEQEARLIQNVLNLSEDEVAADHPLPAGRGPFVHRL